MLWKREAVRLPERTAGGSGRSLDRLGERGRRAAGLAARLLGGWLLGRVQLFGACAPLGPAFAGACGGGPEGACAAAGVMLGAVSRGGLAYGVRYAAVVLLIYIAAFIFRDLPPVRRPWFMPLVTGAMCAAVGGVYLRYGAGDLRTWAAYLAEILLAGGGCVLYRSLLQSGTGKREEKAEVGLLVLGMSLALALWDLQPGGVLSLGRLLAAFAAVTAAYVGGAPYGGLAGLCLGLSLDAAAGLTGVSVLCLGSAGAFAGLFRRRGRAACAVSFVLLHAIAALWSAGPPLRLCLLYEGFAASVAFLLPPEGFFLNIRPGEKSMTKGTAGELRYVRDRAVLAASALRELGRELEAAPAAGRNDEDLLTVFDVAAETCCRRCRRRDRCWGREYEDTRMAMTHAAVKMDQRGSAEPEDLPQWFRDRCLDVRGLTDTVSRELKALYARRQMKSRLRGDRELLGRQYGEFAQVLLELTEGPPPGREERRLERKLDEFLREYAPGTEAGVFRDAGGRLHVDVLGAGAAVLPLRENWVRRLSGALELTLCCPDPGGSILHLYEAEPLEAEVGIASAGRAGREPSGDVTRVFKTPEGRLCLLLADGMGSGSEASREGSAAAAMAEKLLLAGIGPEAVLRLLNTALMLLGEKRMTCAGIDLMQVDLFTGETLICKYGAAPTYVRSGGEVRLLRGGSPAAGQGSGAPDCLRLHLEPGSAAVILSDGAARAEVVRDKLLACSRGGMKAMAREILTDAAARAGWEDDMTVLALGLEKTADGGLV